MDTQYLEQIARQFSDDLWTPKEAVGYCYQEVADLEPTDRATAIREAVSPAMFEHLRNAAVRALDAIPPDFDHFGLGLVTPDAAWAVTEVPRSFVESLANGDATS
ncbi:hypothetical protein KOR34_36850 [Posidoniimonas corsicana]|uniref:Uncharacterized protein n=1 Tax=Posidoniimonas corsicana TaxID=1938618 RepID=A0A5C5V6Z5_9BACT|nr:hypothetical protein [Posidoniimonas corsicana]TWT33850.1 hypothetical protein KOR34_36850 [Posidoniimonas corsicana]